ncbi:hypothetical protein CRENBAI_010209 [Crenichthys baileyi]|uniref:Uncharacterized protein n=1 Tax=Crenichthys baileyi TaxID=28760 RepID=A0AAV9SL14_9TELE
MQHWQIHCRPHLSPPPFLFSSPNSTPVLERLANNAIFNASDLGSKAFESPATAYTPSPPPLLSLSVCPTMSTLLSLLHGFDVDSAINAKPPHLLKRDVFPLIRHWWWIGGQGARKPGGDGKEDGGGGVKEG